MMMMRMREDTSEKCCPSPGCFLWHFTDQTEVKGHVAVFTSLWLLTDHFLVLFKHKVFWCLLLVNMDAGMKNKMSCMHTHTQSSDRQCVGRYSLWMDAALYSAVVAGWTGVCVCVLSLNFLQALCRHLISRITDAPQRTTTTCCRACLASHQGWFFHQNAFCRSSVKGDQKNLLKSEQSWCVSVRTRSSWTSLFSLFSQIK